jgi:hypothetical protein
MVTGPPLFAVAVVEQVQHATPSLVQPELLHVYVTSSSPHAASPQATVTGPPSFAVAVVEQLQEVEASVPHV